MSSLMTIGPIALITPEKLVPTKLTISMIQQLRSDYEHYCGLVEHKPDFEEQLLLFRLHSYLNKLQHEYKCSMSNSLKDSNYQLFLSDLEK